MLLALVWAGDKYAWGSTEIIGLLASSVVLVALFAHILTEFRRGGKSIAAEFAPTP